MQAVTAGALRGYHDTKVPMLIAALGYWGIGFVGGWTLAFPLGIGPAGLWWGFVLGLATVATLLLLRLIRHSAREPRSAGTRKPIRPSRRRRAASGAGQWMAGPARLRRCEIRHIAGAFHQNPGSGGTLERAFAVLLLQNRRSAAGRGRSRAGATLPGCGADQGTYMSRGPAH